MESMVDNEAAWERLEDWTERTNTQCGLRSECTVNGSILHVQHETSSWHKIQRVESPRPV
jgi:hypothetical protein